MFQSVSCTIAREYYGLTGLPFLSLLCCDSMPLQYPAVHFIQHVFQTNDVIVICRTYGLYYSVLFRSILPSSLPGRFETYRDTIWTCCKRAGTDKCPQVQTCCLSHGSTSSSHHLPRTCSETVSEDHRFQADNSDTSWSNLLPQDCPHIQFVITDSIPAFWILRFFTHHQPMERPSLSGCLHCSKQQVSLCFSRCIQRFMAQLHPFQCFSRLLLQSHDQKRRDYLLHFSQ